ncbi:MAG: rhomboid family intramembrane serine protease, partial [Phototrophicaceae bacterium]
MFPIHDANPKSRFPYLTYLLIVANVAVFFWELSLNEFELSRVFQQYSVVPFNFEQSGWTVANLLDIFRSLFFHGGWSHLLGNMLYLFLFGDNVEDTLGRGVFLLIYFAGGFAATWAQIAIEPASRIPLVGASGAIAAILGAYLILFPRVKVRSIIPIAFIPFLVALPAWVVLGFWFVIQLFSGVAALGAASSGGGGEVAFFAHIGGFVFGVFAALLTRNMMDMPDDN